jgi:hypothetical protein
MRNRDDLGRLFFRLFKDALDDSNAQLAAEARHSGPICYGSRSEPHTPVAMQAPTLGDVDLTAAPVASLAEQSNAFTRPICGRHPDTEDWSDFLEHRRTARGQ